MTTDIYFTRTLAFYDWILQFEAKDTLGNEYLATLCTDPREDWKYMVVQYPKDQVDAIRGGKVSLRDLYANASEWWTCEMPYGPGKPTPVLLQTGPIPEDDLPIQEHYLRPADFEWKECFPFDA